MKMKKYIITGGSGFIGTNLILLLLKKKMKILNLDNLSYASNTYLNRISNKNYSFKKIDLSKCKISKLKKIIFQFNPDFIINLAANSHVDNSIKNPLEFVKSNIDTTLNILTSIKDQKKVKFVQIGTDEIYGEIKKNEKKVFNENSKFFPSSPYSASKASCNHLVNSFSRTYGIKYLIINPSNNFGPFQYPEKLIPKSIIKIMNNHSIPVYKKGKNIRQWMYVKDTCNLIDKLSKNKKIQNQTINLGYGKLVNNLDLIKMIFKYIKLKNKNIDLKVKFVTDRKGHDFKYHSSITRSKKLIKFKSSNFIKSLHQTIQWYKIGKNLMLFKKPIK